MIVYRESAKNELRSYRCQSTIKIDVQCFPSHSNAFVVPRSMCGDVCQSLSTKKRRHAWRTHWLAVVSPVIFIINFCLSIFKLEPLMLLWLEPSKGCSQTVAT